MSLRAREGDRHAWIGIGANLGDARAAVERAFGQLDRMPDCALVARSSLWCSAPIDAPGPDYLNAVAHIETSLAPHALLAGLRALEAAGGRSRSAPNAPRTLDLDLLLYDNLQFDSSTLTIPHPRMHRRAFVLAPLIEIDGSVRIPGHGSAADLLAALSDQRIVRLPDPT